MAGYQDYLLHLADNALILGQRNAEWCGHGPIIEEDLALANNALDLIGRLPQEAIVIPVQVLGELFNVLVRKGGRTRADARDALLSWRDALPARSSSTPDGMPTSASVGGVRS